MSLERKATFIKPLSIFFLIIHSCIVVLIEPGKPALSVVDILERDVKENSTLVQVANFF